MVELDLVEGKSQSCVAVLLVVQLADQLGEDSLKEEEHILLEEGHTRLEVEHSHQEQEHSLLEQVDQLALMGYSPAHLGNFEAMGASSCNNTLLAPVSIHEASLAILHVWRRSH